MAPPAIAADTIGQGLTRARDAVRSGQVSDAIAICEAILTSSPNHGPALALLGVARSRAGDIEAGIEQLERAVATNPRVAGWHANLCALYRTLCRTKQAVRAGEAAVRLRPKSPAHLITLALALIDKGDRKNAMTCLLRAIGQDPREASAHLALGQMLLAQGEMQPGWQEYEWRNETPAGKQAKRPRFTSAPWNGMRLNGRLLVVGDQGYGDTIQFARYVPMAARRCQELVLACSAALAPLLSKLPGVTSCHHRWNEVPPHAAHIGLSSLPFLFRTELHTIPSPEPYLFADPARAEVWRQRLTGIAGLRVGLVWSGRPTHPNDRRRSLRLRALLPLAGIEGLRFVSLQKPVSPEDVDTIRQFPGLEDHSNALIDFGETAALMRNLDLAITVDTAAAHLAGALGLPAWVLLARPSDWRWMLDRADSPWYPSLRLFRQPVPGAWREPIGEVAAALREWAAGRRGKLTSPQNGSGGV
jgi:hypothetical protein